MTTIEYLALPWYKRIFHKIKASLIQIPLAIVNFFKNTIPGFFIKIGKSISNVFRTIVNSFTDGDYKTRVSFVVMGFGQITRGSIVRGMLNLIYEIAFFIYFFLIGLPNLLEISTFGNIAKSSYENEFGLEVYKFTDDSFLILLFTIITVILMFILVFLWYKQIIESLALQNLNRIGRKASDKEIVNDLVGKNYHMVLLSFPTLGLVVFTIIPLVFMILVAFTNFSSNYQNPNELFDWVGSYNFQVLFGMGGGGNSQFVSVFLQILLWTLVWAFFATFTNYFLGMGVALLINKKGIKLKKIWRTALITTIAVPQFISLLFLSKFLNTDLGALNHVLKDLGVIENNIKFLEDGMITKVTIIIVNMWIGIPYTMLMCSGILMNVPQDLYESSRIDGASPFKMYMKITLPYMLFVTGPYLISNFVGNINNFNVIYLLSGGGPKFTSINGQAITANIYEAGQTDLLITWLYKLAMTSVKKEYGLASVIGIFVFIVVASFSLILYGRSNSVKNEGDFQ